MNIKGLVGFINNMHQKLNGAEIGAAVSRVGQVQALTTVGAGTLTAALLQPGGVIARTGPVGGYADTLATGAQMDAAYPEVDIGESFKVRYSNRVAQICTLTASAGMTAAGGTVVAIPASTTVDIILTRTAANTWTFEL